jgi:hypothetical protein
VLPIAVTPQCCNELVTDTVISFRQQLHELQVTEKKNNSIITSPINPADISFLVHFFFHNTFGAACQKRIFALLDEIVSKIQVSTTPASLAMQKARDKALLPEMQAFFSTYARWHAEEEKETQIMPVIAQTIRGFDLYDAFYQLRTKASGPEGDDLRKFLAAQGFSTSIGRDVRSCILKYFARELDISSGQLSNTLQTYQGIFLLAQRFGKGILVLLPKGASHR